MSNSVLTLTKFRVDDAKSNYLTLMTLLMLISMTMHKSGLKQHHFNFHAFSSYCAKTKRDGRGTLQYLPGLRREIKIMIFCNPDWPYSDTSLMITLI